MNYNKFPFDFSSPILRPEFLHNDTIDRNEISKYHGFAVDLFNNLSSKADFRYELMFRDKNEKLGVEDPKEGWNGIIKELITFKADFAITDIVISQARKRAIDFSLSFRTLGKKLQTFRFLQIETNLASHWHRR